MIRMMERCIQLGNTLVGNLTDLEGLNPCTDLVLLDYYARNQ